MRDEGREDREADQDQRQRRRLGLGCGGGGRCRLSSRGGSAGEHLRLPDLPHPHSAAQGTRGWHPRGREHLGECPKAQASATVHSQPREPSAGPSLEPGETTSSAVRFSRQRFLEEFVGFLDSVLAANLSPAAKALTSMGGVRLAAVETRQQGGGLRRQPRPATPQPGTFFLRVLSLSTGICAFSHPTG
jgi:hypothetical protein